MDWIGIGLLLWQILCMVTALYAFIGGIFIPGWVRKAFPHIEMKTRLVAFFFASVAYCVTLQMEQHTLRETLRSAGALMLFLGMVISLCLGWIRLMEGKGAIKNFFTVWRRE